MLRRDASNVHSQILVGQVHREAGRLGEARRHLNEALALDASAAEAWNELGGVAQAERDDKKALECFERALALKPDLIYARLNAAQVCLRLGRAAEAVSHYRFVLGLDGAHAEAHNGLGLALATVEPAEAEREFREAVRLQPSLGPAWNNLAVLLLQTKREAEALAILRSGLREAPKEELLYLNLARVHVARGDRAAARSAVEELLRRVPGSEVGRKALAQLDTGR